jgi:hypothetical protein
MCHCVVNGFATHQTSLQSVIWFSNNDQQDATLYNNLYFTFNAVHVSGGFSTHHQELKELYTQHRVLSSFCAAYR